MYKDLENMGHTSTQVTPDNKTYICLTEKGKKSCLRKLEEVQSLTNYLSRINQDKYAEEEDKSKDLRSKSQGLTDTELKFEGLIMRISSWD